MRKDGMGTRTYEAPSVTDYGTLVELTAATDFTGPLDGAMFEEPHHS
jgi:hypothetical protein